MIVLWVAHRGYMQENSDSPTQQTILQSIFTKTSSALMYASDENDGVAANLKNG